MNIKRMLCVSSLATGVGIAGLLGIGIASANAATAATTDSQHGTVQLASQKIKPTHHQKNEIGKQAKKQAKHDGLAPS
jgi:hypothetical protein